MRLIKALKTKMDSEIEATRSAEIARLKLEDKSRPLYQRAYEGIAGLFTNKFKKDFESMAQVTEGMVLERVIANEIASYSDKLKELKFDITSTKEEYLGLKQEERKTKSLRNRTFDKLKEGEIKMQALEETLTEDYALREKYLEEKEQEGYTGEYDTLIADIDQRINTAEERREDLEMNRDELESASVTCYHDHQFAKQAAQKVKTAYICVQDSYRDKERDLKAVQSLKDDSGKRRSLISIFKRVADLENCPIGYLRGIFEEQGEDMLEVMHDANTRSSEKNSSGNSIYQDINKSHEERREKIMAQIEKERYAV